MFVLLCALLSAAPEKLVVSETRLFDPELKTLAAQTQERLATEFARLKRFDVLAASDLQDLLGLERQRALLGCDEVSTSCMGEIGAALGAPWLVSSSLGKAGKKVRLDLKFISTERGTVAVREGGEVTADEIPRLVDAAVGRVEEWMRSREGPSPLGPLVTAGLGVAAIGVGAVLLSQVPPARAALQSEVRTLSVEAVTQRQASLASQATAGTAVLAAGAALAVGGVTWWLLQPRGAGRSATASLWVAPGPGGLVMAGAF